MMNPKTVRETPKTKTAILQARSNKLLDDIRSLIESARMRVATAVNAGLVILYWQVGQRIRTEILRGKRAEYGKAIVSTLWRQLDKEYGDGFGEKNLRRMIQFAGVFREKRIVASLMRQLSWTHFTLLLPIEGSLKRGFYAEMCRIERWSVRTLRQKIDGMLYERTAVSKKPAQVVERELKALRAGDRMTPDLVFRDPYFLDFLGLKDAHREKDVERAILREMESFILELGTGFSFVARQKRITIDHRDYYLDLLFFHRRLKRLVAVELKLGQFQAQDKGQMELYLNWLARHERQPSERSPMGLILCAGKAAEHVELLELEKSGIRIAEYVTELPPRRILEKKLHEALLTVREKCRDPV
jgi:predicted nuclease of restriction endonuclease-like (RecB) superfamily